MGQLTVILILLGAQILTFLYFRTVLRRELSKENRIDEIRREIEQLMIELDHSADRNIEIIEDRTAKLKNAVKDGERIIRLIESEKEKRAQAVPLYNDLRGMVRPEFESTDGTAKEHPVDIIGITPGEGNTAESSSGPLADADTGDSLDIELMDDRERALDLHRQGMDPAVIASSTGLPRGEVELIISLNSKG